MTKFEKSRNCAVLINKRVKELGYYEQVTPSIAQEQNKALVNLMLSKPIDQQLWMTDFYHWF